MERLMTLDEFLVAENLLGSTRTEQAQACDAYAQAEIKKEQVIGNLAIALEYVVMVSLKASPQEVAFGHPCSGLIDCAMTGGIKGIAENLVEKPGEFRLNGAGLKLYVSYNGKLKAKVGGDQYNEYPQTGPALNAILEKRGLQGE
ncbi:MAG: hypothetical protein Q8N55_02275 [bacterium]|nr:hypothetical protein [bacterium]